MKKVLLFLSLISLSLSIFAEKQNKNIHLSITPFGFYSPNLIHNGVLNKKIFGYQPINIGYYINDDWFVALEYGSTTLASAEFETDEEKIKGKLTYDSIGINGRWYWSGQTGYLSLAYHQRDFKISGQSENNITKEKKNAGVGLQASTLALGVGTEWIWDFGLVIGFDWLVLPAVLSANASTTGVETSKKLKKDAKKAITLLHTIPGGLIWRIGYAF